MAISVSLLSTAILVTFALLRRANMTPWLPSYVGQLRSYRPPTSGNMTNMAVDKSDTEIAMH